MSGVDRQKKYLDLIYKAGDSYPFYVANNWRRDGRVNPGKQHVVGSNKCKPPHIAHRSILPNEVVLDLDAKTFSANRRTACKIIEYLVETEIPYALFWSGGKGVHIHVWFNMNLTDDSVIETMNQAVENKIDIFSLLRLKLADKIVSQSGLTEEQRKTVDYQKLRWNPMSRPPLIRCAGGANIKKDKDGNDVRNYKTLFSVLPNRAPKLEDYEEVDYPSTIELHSLDQYESAQAVQEKLDLLSNTEITLPTKSISKFEGKFLNLPCVEKLRENGMPVGKRNLGSKVLALACKLDGLSLEDCKQVIKEYIQNLPKGNDPYTEEEAFRWVDWVYQQQITWWPRTLIKEGLCDEHTCPYFSHKFEKHLAVFDVDDPLKIVKEVLDEKIVGEDQAKLTLFLIYLTKEFIPEWSVMMDGDASSGKTHMIKAVAELFGEEGEEYFVISRITPAALDYLGESAEDLKHKIVIIEELQGAKPALENLRVVISSGFLNLMTPQEVKLPDGTVTRKTDLTSKVDMRGTLFVTCNAEEEDAGGQMQSRSWIINTDITTAQTQGIVDKSLNEWGCIPNRETDEKVKEIRAGIKFLKKPDHILCPFGKELRSFLDSRSVRARRDVKKMKSAIEAHALISQKRRRWYTNKKGETILVADWRDIYYTFIYAGKILTASTQGIGSKQLEYYDKILLNFSRGTLSTFTNNDAAQWFGLSVESARRTLTRLNQAGFIHNTTYPPASARWELTSNVPKHLGDIITFCGDSIGNQEELIDEWAEEQGLKLQNGR